MSRSFHLPLSLLCVITLPASVNAQTAPTAPPPAHSHAPAPSGHPGGIVTLDQFVTTATPFSRNQIDLAQSTTVLSGRSLLLKQQATLGETLSAETGMSATSFGPGASRPIIRGLGGDRIRLLENSVAIFDASVTSPDHAVSVEPFLVERIEIVRGPASLLYGSNAVGGVVNVITHRIETDLPTERVRGSAEVRSGSAAEDFARGGVLDLSVPAGTEKAVVFHFDGFRRSTEDVRIPGFAESQRIRDEETEHAIEEGEPAPAFAQGRLPNSALDSTSAAGGISYVSKTFHVGASYSGFDSNYGVPGHAHEESPGEADGVRIDLRQRRTDLQAEWHGEAGLLHGARFKFGQANYRHTEIEPDGGLGTTFSNEGYDARLELLHGGGKSWSGSLGVQSSRSDFSAIGEEAFLPPNQTRNDALFVFEEVANGPLTWQFGGRVESARVTPEAGGTRREELFSGAAGLVWKFDDTHALAVSLTHTSRMPNAQELYAYGAHAGTQSFEIGDANLAAEDCLGLELSLRRRQGVVTGALTLFANQFDNFIFEQPTGQVAVEEDGSWVFLPAGSGEEDALPVYQYVQREARFWGVEVETLWHLHDQSDWQLDLRLAGELTRAEEDAANLPRIPAARLTAGLVWANAAWSAGADCQWTLRQDRVAPNETPSDSYALVSAHVSHVIGVGRTKWELFLRGTNLANQEARPHTSFVKELAPLPGRGVTAGVRLTF